MKQTHSYGEKVGQFVAVLLPIFITQLSLIATGFCNTVMAGHISEMDLAGVAVGVNIFMPFFGATLGIISGLTPIIAQYYGAGKSQAIRYTVQQGFYWALGLAVLFLAIGYADMPVLLPYLDLEPHVAYITSHYLMAVSCGIVPIFLAAVVRNFIDAHGYTRLTMGITMCTVPVNIALNYIFMYGKFGMPAFGGIGAGIGSALAFTLNLVLNVTVALTLHPFRDYHIFRNLPRPRFRAWRRHLGVGVPIGATMFTEQSIFGAVGLFMTTYGTAVVAAHQAAMNFTTIVYMIPLSISMALTILVGYEVGARRMRDARQYIRLGRVLSLVFVSAIALPLTRHQAWLASLYASAPELQSLICTFLVYVIFMQMSDCINAPLQGALRGYKDVRVTFWLAVVSNWVVGLPLGWVMAQYGGMGPYGYWIGLIGGILVGSIFLMFRLRRVEKKFDAIV
jgi:MATE family multidrug resistance protein